MTTSIEYRLYHDEHGNPTFYTCEKPEGIYIVVDQQTYLECRFDVKIVDGKLIQLNQIALISKLVPSDTGTKCAAFDINIIVKDDYEDTITWKVKTHEFQR
jgi:hypothetical protein